MSERARLIKSGNEGKGDVIYWMSRDQRLDDNHALIFAQSIATSRKRHLRIIFVLNDEFLGATRRHFDFMMRGLEQLAEKCKLFNISFELLRGEPGKTVAIYSELHNVCCVVTDFDPLNIKKKWKLDLCEITSVPVFEVDSHNIVPLWVASNKLEFAAYTLRPKITKLLPGFLIDIPKLIEHPYGEAEISKLEYIPVNYDTFPDISPYLAPGESEACRQLNVFIESKLNNYSELRNDPSLNYQSGLSPYLHFGMISAQRIALEVQKANVNPDSEDAFLEELIIRKELSDNFCYFNPEYDKFNGFHNWAKTTLNEHRNDLREHLYTIEQFANAETHDKYWNAAQTEMVITGKMHGYMRMYWAKKILEWTRSPEEALDFGIFLNDKFSLDGRDPNGYAGIAWSIGGVHDRAWNERPIFGKIRYMNDSGLKRKFDIEKYVENIKHLKNENNNRDSNGSLFGSM